MRMCLTNPTSHPPQNRCNAMSWNPMEAFNFTAANEDCCLYTFDMRKLTSATCVHKVRVALGGGSAAIATAAAAAAAPAACLANRPLWTALEVGVHGLPTARLAPSCTPPGLCVRCHGRGLLAHGARVCGGLVRPQRAHLQPYRCTLVNMRSMGTSVTMRVHDAGQTSCMQTWGWPHHPQGWRGLLALCVGVSLCGLAPPDHHEFYI